MKLATERILEKKRFTGVGRPLSGIVSRTAPLLRLCLIGQRHFALNFGQHKLEVQASELSFTRLRFGLVLCNASQMSLTLSRFKTTGLTKGPCVCACFQIGQRHLALQSGVL